MGYYKRRRKKFVGFYRDKVFYRVDGQRPGWVRPFILKMRTNFKYKKIIKYQTAMSRRTL